MNEITCQESPAAEEEEVYMNALPWDQDDFEEFPGFEADPEHDEAGSFVV